jgi:ribokinase
VSRDRVDLVLVGHFGFAEDHTHAGTAISLGGSGYACSVGATSGDPRRVGVVGNIGEDFDVAAIERLCVDTKGAVVRPGKAPHLSITQHTLSDRSFRPSLGVAAEASIGALPSEYLDARHLHIATMPPVQQMCWLKTIRRLSRCSVSVDMFESTAAEFPKESRELCYASDLVFMNVEECRLLFADHPLPSGQIALKAGPAGASFWAGTQWLRGSAPTCEAVDTTGAGEVLAGAFLSLRAMGLDAAFAVRLAVEAASAKVTEFGVDGPHLRAALSSIHGRAVDRLGQTLARPGSGPMFAAHEPGFTTADLARAFTDPVERVSNAGAPEPVALNMQR